MKMIFLVDGDNNIGTGLQGIDLLTAEDTVLVFFGKGQTLANVKKLCAGTKAQVQYLESVKGGKNSLDFQIITELGVLVGRGEADFAYVISQDKGYEAAIECPPRPIRLHVPGGGSAPLHSGLSPGGVPAAGRHSGGAGRRPGPAVRPRAGSAGL